MCHPPLSGFSRLFGVFTVALSLLQLRHHISQALILSLSHHHHHRPTTSGVLDHHLLVVALVPSLRSSSVSFLSSIPNLRFSTGICPVPFSDHACCSRLMPVFCYAAYSTAVSPNSMLGGPPPPPPQPSSRTLGIVI